MAKRTTTSKKGSASKPAAKPVPESAAKSVDTPTRPSLSQKSPMAKVPVLRGAFARITEEGFDGYVYDESDLGRRFVVELLLDGVPLKLARANVYSRQPAQQRIGDARYGFSFMV